MNCSIPGSSVLHYFLELAQIHICWVGDTISPPHPLPPSPPFAFSLSQHQGLFQWVGSSHQVAKVHEASASASRYEMSKFITQLQWKGGIGSKINNGPVEYNRESRNRLIYSLPHSWKRNWSLVEKRKSSIINAESIRYPHGEKLSWPLPYI